VEILKSVPVWAVFIVQNGSSFSFWTLLTQIPSYMNHVMKFNIKDVRFDNFEQSINYITDSITEQPFVCPTILYFMVAIICVWLHF